MKGRPNGGLHRAIDKEVHQVICKLMDDDAADNDSAPLPTTMLVWEKIQRSNSSLRRRPKALIIDSIERVLEVIAEEAAIDSPHESKAEDVQESVQQDGGDAMNRHIRKYIAFGSSGNASDPQEITSNSVKKRPHESLPSRPAVSKRAKKSTASTSHVMLEDVGGMGHIIRFFKDKVLPPLARPDIFLSGGIKPPRGILLHGPPGCGKTLLAEALAGSLGVPFLSISAPSVVSGMSGESEKQLRQHFEHAVSLAPCLMFVDEIDAITPKRDSAQREMERRIVAQLLTCMDDLALEKTGGKPVIVLAATNRPDSLDPALRRAGRFDIELRVGVPNPETRASILRAQTQKMRIDADVDFEELGKLTAGFVGADLAQLVSAAGALCFDRTLQVIKSMSLSVGKDPTSTENMEVDGSNPDQPVLNTDVQDFNQLRDILFSDRPIENPQIALTREDFLLALPNVQPSARREGFTTVPDTTWAAVGALDAVREQLVDAIVQPIRDPAKYERWNVAMPTGVLLYGPPGCGKTLLAKAVANEAGASFISVSGPELTNKYVGESEKAIRQIFSRAAASIPCIIFFDEMDCIIPTRGDGASVDSTNRIVAQFLTELDGLRPRNGIYVIAATNRMDVIDPAMLRPGRLGKHLYVGVPSDEGRVQIFRTKLHGVPYGRADVMESFVRTECAGFTGAHIQNLVAEAAMKAMKRGGDVMELQDLVAARPNAVPSSRKSVSQQAVAAFRDM